jgi:hypothetical protein
MDATLILFEEACSVYVLKLVSQSDEARLYGWRLLSGVIPKVKYTVAWEEPRC